MGEQGGDQNVKVAIRCRPLSQKELGNSESSIVEVQAPSSDKGPGSIAINDPDGKEHPTSFAFDIVFDVNTEQSHVFDLIGRPALDSTMNGFNGTIFAYGQTGSGKSWCMSGGAGDLRGIIPRVNELLFDRIAQEQAEVSTKKFLVMCSFFEIYNEIIFDLLNPPADRSKLGAGLQVKEHPVLGIYVKDLGEIVVNDAAKLESLMSNGVKNRAVSSTLMNATSSRSHSIFTIKVHQKDDQDTSKNVFAKLNLVDLAGSERQKGTGASGQTLKEGANINKSLSALGNVINALVENAGGKKVFVPYRNSKLTRVLQESLGGNSLCTMLATLSPAACNYEETLSTLRYANRAKAIKVSAVKNEEASQISRLNAEILELKKKLASSGGQEGGAMGHMADEERQELQAKYKSQLSEMQQMVNSTWEEKARLSADHEAQLNKALQAHKRQAKAMEEECNKRFRLLQEQNDLEFSIRGLLDTLQSVPLKDGAAGASAPLRSGELPKKWLKMVADIDETVDALKERNTTSQVFQAAYGEELRLWVEGEEASDAGMVRTGARRALMKLETLKKECAKLVEMQAECGRKLQELAATVQQVSGEWEASGSAAVLAELQGEDTQGSEQEQAIEGVRGVLSQTLQDISRILRLIQEQAQGKVVQLDGTTSVAMSATCELLLKGMSLSGFEHNVSSDIVLLRTTSAASEAGSPPADHPGTEPAAQPRPREERPLHEWTPEDADDTVQGTAYTLALLVPLETLHKKKSPEELLARPPPKFVHDVALLVQQVTGFPSTLTEEWSENREAKLDILQLISDSTAGCLGIGSIEFDPADVLKGKEVEKTLRLLQLLAIAAAKEKANPGGAVSAARAHRDRRKAEGQVSSAEMSTLLEAMARCVQGVLQHLEQKQVEDGHASPTRELESKYKALQERLKEETEMRKRQESRLAELKEQLQQISAKVSEGAATLDRCRQAATDAAEKKGEMRRHVEQLRGGLLHRAQQLDSNPQVNQTRMELEQMTAQLQSQLERKTQLAADVKKLAQHRTEVESHKESLELEVRLVKLRLAEGLTNITPTQSDEVLQLQAEKQKLDVRVTALEERLRAISDSDDMERENSLIEENKLLQGKLDEAQTQLQVMTEERDALREGMQQHWQEKTQMEEEVLQVAQGYTALSTRAMDIKDEIRELQEKLHEYETLLSMLEELNNHSPQGSGRGEASLGVPTDKASSTCGNAAASTGPTATGGDDDEGSSHYSDDPFEEPEED